MLIEKRLSEIVRIVEERKSIAVQELMQLLQASESTIRRDLTTLHNNGMLIKVHGGAIAVGNDYATKDDEVRLRKEINREEKIKIARYAASFVEPDDFIFLDAGTTTELMIDFISEKNVVFVTNAIMHAKKLAQSGFRAYILGGELKTTTEAVIGDEVILELMKFNFTKGFFGTNGIHRKSGFSTPDFREANVKKKAMERCKECFVLGDSSKFNQISSVTFAEFKRAKVITTKLEDSTFAGCSNILEVSE